MPDFTAGKALPFDPQEVERERRAYRAPLEYATMAAGPIGLLGRGVRVGILSAGAKERAQALANALRKKPEEAVERMFMP